MRTRIPGGWLCLFLLVVFPAPAPAQTDWSAVQMLPHGARLRVVLPAEVLEGRMRGADPAGLSLDARRLDRGDVRQIDRLRTQKARGALRGALVGLVAGMVQGYASAEINKGAWAANLAGRWGALGALIGTMWGAGAERTETIYRR